MHLGTGVLPEQPTKCQANPKQAASSLVGGGTPGILETLFQALQAPDSTSTRPFHRLAAEPGHVLSIQPATSCLYVAFATCLEWASI